MTKAKTKDVDLGVRVLSPEEYPAAITAPSGAYTPDVRFAAIHPLGLFYVDHQGAGHYAAMFVPKRKGSRHKNIGGGSSLAGALRRVSAYEDELTDPSAKRETGSAGPVNVFSLGNRLEGKKSVSQLDREIAALLSRLS